MVELRSAIYVVMACAFGGCAEDEPYCTREQAACVCKSTMKLDMSSIEPPTNRNGPLCNNATFDWMVNTMLQQISNLNQQIGSFATERKKFTEDVQEFEVKNRELREMVRARDSQIQNHERITQDLENKLQEVEERKEKETQNSKLQEEIQSLKDKISELEKTNRRLEFENIRLKENNQVANEELEQLKQTNKKKPRDCADIQTEGFRSSGVFNIYPEGAADPEGVEVFCDLHTEGGGWLMIQRRQDGSQRFDVDWETYKKGFGKVAREFWLGNELLHQITTRQGEYELRIDMTNANGDTGHAHYSSFSLDNEVSDYRLHVGQHSGTVGDSLSHHDDSPFSTLDVDNDESRSGHCSQLYGYGGWWFVRCYDSNLNGQFGKNDKTGVVWFHWKEDSHKSLRHVEMKIRPVNFIKNQQKEG